MKEGRASQTALLVAFMRAVADLGVTSVPEFRDPIARNLLAPPWSNLLRLAAWRLPKASRQEREAAAGMMDMLSLRTVLIDSYLREALARGVRQVVILGAGLDGRAYRLRELAGADVFEVDHPATQAFKRARLGSLTPIAKSLRFVAVDFEKDSLDAALEQAGHRANEPTFFIWEGVVMYLTDAALLGTLRVVAARASRGSSIVINYATPSNRSPMMKLVLGLWSEPMIGARTPATMKAMLEGCGFELVQDSGMPEWAQRFGAQPPRPSIDLRFRMALASTRSSSADR